MSTATATYPSGGFPAAGKLLLLMILAFAALASGVLLKEHAEHHSTAEAVRNCPQENWGATLVNPLTGRKAQLCEFKLGEWGRFITEFVDGVEEEVTAFAHSTRAARNFLDAVLKQLIRGGYRLESAANNTIQAAYDAAYQAVFGVLP